MGARRPPSPHLDERPMKRSRALIALMLFALLPPSAGAIARAQSTAPPVRGHRQPEPSVGDPQVPDPKSRDPQSPEPRAGDPPSPEPGVRDPRVPEPRVRDLPPPRER